MCPTPLFSCQQLGCNCIAGRGRPGVKRRHFYKGSCSQAPETPNCPLATGESSTHLKKDSLRWETAQEGTEASLPPQFNDSFITAFFVHKASVAHPDCSCWARHPQLLPQGSILLRTHRKSLPGKNKWDYTAFWTAMQSLDTLGMAKGLVSRRWMS